MKCFTHASLREIGLSLNSNSERGGIYLEQTGLPFPAQIQLGRAVLILTSLMLLLMPVSEHVMSWDRFLWGGSDVEFGMLCLLLFAGLVLLIARSATKSLLLLLFWADACGSRSRLIPLHPPPALPMRDAAYASGALPLTAEHAEMQLRI